MNKFISLIIALTAVFILLAIVCYDLPKGFIILSFLLLIIAPCISED